MSQDPSQFIKAYGQLCEAHNMAIGVGFQDGKPLSRVVKIPPAEAAQIADHLTKQWEVDQRVDAARKAAEQEIFGT